MREKHAFGASQIEQAETGSTVWVRVEKILSGYIQVRLEDGRPGIIARQELSLEGDVHPRELVFPGERLPAQIIGKSSTGKSIALSHRRFLGTTWSDFVKAHQVGDVVSGWVKNIYPHGVYVEIVPGIDGLISLAELAPWSVDQPGDVLHIGDGIEATILAIDVKKSPPVRLSLRQHVLHLYRSHALAERLGIEQGASMSAGTQDVLYNDVSRPRNSILILEDHLDLAQALQKWLSRQGWRVWTVTTPEEMQSFLAAMQNQDLLLDAALIDIDLGVRKGWEWIPTLRVRWPHLQVAVMSDAQQLQIHQDVLRQQNVSQTFVKPLDRDAVARWLSEIKKKPSSIPPKASAGIRTTEVSHRGRKETEVVLSRSSMFPLSDVVSERENLQRILQQLCRSTGAQTGILAKLEPGRKHVTFVATWGHVSTDPEGLNLLAHSPVKDVLEEGRTLLEKQAATGKRQAYFANLLRWMPFESCIGLQVRGAYRTPHAIFLFHREPGHFTRRHLRRTITMATAIAASLDRIYFARQLTELSGYILAGRLAASVNHELATTIGSLDVQLVNLQSRVETDEPLEQSDLRKALENLRGEVDRMSELLDSFQDMHRERQTVGISLSDLLHRVRSIVRALAGKYEVNFDHDMEVDVARLPVPGNATAVQQVLFNLCLNAIQHLATLPKVSKQTFHVQRRLRLSVRKVVRNTATHLAFYVEDNGPGIHADYALHIFEPGFTTRPGGSGLGLFIARSLVEALGGRVALLESKPLVRTVFVVELPLIPDLEPSGKSSHAEERIVP